jgi:hypothetical protein
VIYLLWWDLYAIATDPGTIAKVQGLGFSSPKIRGRFTLRHLRPCAAISGAVLPPRALQSHPWHYGDLCWRDVTTPTAMQTLGSVYGQRPDAGAGRATLEVASGPARHRSNHDACKDQDSSGKPSNHKYCTPVPKLYTIGHAARL